MFFGIGFTPKKTPKMPKIAHFHFFKGNFQKEVSNHSETIPNEFLVLENLTIH